MPCTTILVGKNATYDGSTMIARNDDSASGHFTPKKFVVVHPEEQPRTYRSAKGAATCIQSGTFFCRNSASRKSASLYGYAKCSGRERNLGCMRSQ